MPFVWRRRVRLDDNTAANVSTHGVSVSRRHGRVTVSSKGRVSVRILRGLSFRGKLW